MKKCLIIRKQRKGYGTDRLIEGNPQPGDNVLIVEDVTASGTSVMKAIRALEEIDCKVFGIVTIINRQEGCDELLKDYNFWWITTKAELDALERDSVLTLAKLDEVLRQVEQVEPSILRITTHPTDLDYIKDRLRDEFKDLMSKVVITDNLTQDTLFDIPIIPMESVPPDTLIVWHPDNKFTIVKNLRTGGWE
jgi:hypothetical protein